MTDLRPAGRPTKLTPETAFLICEAIRNGTPLEVAARANGVGDSTFHSWRSPCPGPGTEAHADRGPGCHEPVLQLKREWTGAGPSRTSRLTPLDPPEYLDFRDMVERSVAACEALMVGAVARAAPKDWRAAFAILRARFPDRWNVANKTELTGDLDMHVSLSARERVRGKLGELAQRGAIVALPPREPEVPEEPDVDEKKAERPRRDRPIVA